MRGVLRARARMEHGKKLRSGVDGQPEPEHLCVLASSGQPAGDGRLLVAEDPFSRGRIQPTSSGREHHCDLL
jgi:hypothetical protein